MTIEDLRLSGQRTVGIANRGNVLSIRRLRSTNSVPPISSIGGYPPGLLTVIDSRADRAVNGQAPAVDNDGGAFLRNVTSRRVRALGPAPRGEQERRRPAASGPRIHPRCSSAGGRRRSLCRSREPGRA